MISVITPVWHEKANLPQLLSNLESRFGENPAEVEILFVDGDPLLSTGALIANLTERYGSIRSQIRVLSCAHCSRGVQMNFGATAATGEFLCFLHADTLLPPNAKQCIEESLEKYDAGAFALGILDSAKKYRLIERMANVRTHLNRIPYGDQAIFLKKSVFAELGGFRNIPILEEVDLMRRFLRKGYQIDLRAEKVLTSARRWEREGALYTTIRNWYLAIRFFAGASPWKIRHLYAKEPDETP